MTVETTVDLISSLCTAYKIYFKVVAHSVQNIVQITLLEEQNVFLKSRFYMDRVSTLQQPIEKR